MSIHGVLGENTHYPKTYNPDILYPISRNVGRDEIKHTTGFCQSYQGVDIWQAFEISWLNPKGISQVAILKLFIPADSPNIVESKSLKLYFNSLNFTMFEDKQQLIDTIIQDISFCVKKDIKIYLGDLSDESFNTYLLEQKNCIDDALDFHQDNILLTHDIDSSFLQNFNHKNHQQTYQFYSNLLRSNCPVTNQPDWGSVFFEITTSYQLDFAKILQYILSFRQHNGFHEQCVERMFADFMVHLNPSKLKIWANYTRRGGIDINPIRVFNTDFDNHLKRTIRQ